MVVSGAPKQTSFDRGVARELAVVLTASDNMAAYRCNANNEAKKTVTAQTRLRVYCESDSTLQSTTPEFCMFYLSNPRPRSHSNRFEDHCRTDGAPPRADADSGVQLSNQQPQGQHLLEFKEPQVCLAEMLDFCEISPIVSSLNGGFVSQVGGSGTGHQQRPLWRRVRSQRVGSKSDFTAPQAEGHLPGLQPRSGRRHQHVLST